MGSRENQLNPKANGKESEADAVHESRGVLEGRVEGIECDFHFIRGVRGPSALRGVESSATLRGANLCGARLSLGEFRGIDGRGALLRGADLSFADLTTANLSRADLAHADLCKAEFRGADLRGANLCGADLTGADLTDTDLRGAKLQGATLEQACLAGCRIDLSTELPIQLEEAQARGARFCSDTEKL